MPCAMAAARAARSPNALASRPEPCVTNSPGCVPRASKFLRFETAEPTMSQISIDQVLSQIRSIAAQTQAPGIKPAALTSDAAAASGTGAVSGAGNSFATLMRSGIEQANQTEL